MIKKTSASPKYINNVITENKAHDDQRELASCVQSSACSINLPLDTIPISETVPMESITETDDNTGWTNVNDTRRNNKSTRSWKQRLDILRGTALSENENESLSADVHLVAYGIAKNVTGIQLSQWLAGKGLHIVSCDLLTRYDGARSLSYKVTIKSRDYQKATSPEIWPARVGVRLFKFFDNQNATKSLAGKSRSVEQSTIDYNKNNIEARTDQGIKRKSILKQTQRNGNPNNSQIHIASQDQKMNLSARYPFQHQNFQNLSSHGQHNGYINEYQNNRNNLNGIETRFQQYENSNVISPLNDNLYHRSPEQNIATITGPQNANQNVYANDVNGNLYQQHHESTLPKMKLQSVRFCGNLRNGSYV